MKITRLAAPAAAAATLFVGVAGASAGSTPSYVTQIDRICASLPSTPNITGTISAANISNAARTEAIFKLLMSKLNGVDVPKAAADASSIEHWAFAVGVSTGYLHDAVSHAKAGDQSAYLTYLKKAFAVAAAGKKYAEQGGLTGC